MKKIIFFVISGLIVLAFAFFGLSPGLLGGGGRGIALSVNDQVVSSSSFRNMLRSASKNQATTKQESSKQRRLRRLKITQQLLNELTQLNITYVTLVEANFYISSLAVINQIVSIPAFLENNRFKRSKYESLLKSIGQNPDSFESQIEKSLVYQQFIGWIQDSLQISDLENHLKNSVLNSEIHLNLFALKKPDSSKKKALKIFNKQVIEIKKLLKTANVKKINNWKSKNKIKLSKTDKLTLSSAYIPILGNNKLAYKNILTTRPKNFTKNLIFHQGAYYLVYVKKIIKTKKNTQFKPGLLDRWFAGQRQQAAIQTWLTDSGKNLQIYKNQNLLKL